MKDIVMYQEEVYQYLGDFHTHTVFSMHGMSSPTEMVNYAIQNCGLKYIAITDHFNIYPVGYPYDPSIGSDPNFFVRENQKARMWEYERAFKAVKDLITVIPGYEYNLFDKKECRDISIRANSIHYPHLRLIGLHNWYYYGEDISYDYLLIEIERKFSSGDYHIFVHPEREINKLMYDVIDIPRVNEVLKGMVNLCHKYGVIIEVNESSVTNNSDEKTYWFRRAFMEQWLRYAKDQGLDIIIGSDAHSIYDIGANENALKLLEEVGYPAKNIINFDDDKIQSLISKIRKGEA